MSSSAPACWQLADLEREIVEELAQHHGKAASMIDGRALAVKASPARGNATSIAMGTAALPPRYQTPPHAHEAEEIALFLSGRGQVEIDGDFYPVGPGTLLVTPSGAEHTTYSQDSDQPLVVLWFYAPPGSETRWMNAESAPVLPL